MEDIAGIMTGGLAIVALFIGLPWLVLHYITKWKQAPGIAPQDENLLDEMYNLARRLEERVQTVERIVAADHPEFRTPLSPPRADYSLDRPIDRRN